MAFVFIESIARDRVRARRVGEALRGAGHEVSYLDDIVGPGAPVAEALARHLREVDAVVVCLSEAAARSGWFLQEWERLGAHVADRSRRVLPVRFEAAELPAELNALVCLDLFPGEVAWQGGLARLQRAILRLGRGSDRASPEPLALLPPNNLPPRLTAATGRVSELASLHALLAADRTARVAIQGPGGIGKSALALEYAYRSADAYPGGIWWVHGDREPVEALSALGEELRSIGPQSVRALLDRVPRDAPTEVAGAVQKALSGGEQSTLVVIDDGVPAVWEAHLPGGAVRTIFTSRDAAEWKGPTVTLPPLSQEEGVALAQRIVGGEIAPEEYEALLRVAHWLEGLPLAVSMAAHVVRDGGARWADLAAMFNARPRGSDGEREAMSLARLVEVLVVALREDSHERAILEAVSVFGPEAVPVEWVAGALELDPDSERFREALRRLEGMSLASLQPGGGNVAVHPLVHVSVARLTPPERLDARRERVAEVAARSLLRPERGHEEAPPPSQIEAVMGAVFVQNDPSLNARVATVIARRLRRRGQLSTARALVERSISAAEGGHGVDDTSHTRLLTESGLVLRAQGELSGARERLAQVLAVSERVQGADHPAVATHLSNLALVLKDQGDLRAARAMLERALAIDEHVLGSDHPDMATRLSNLALVLNSQGDLPGARAMLERALAIDERVLGPTHPAVATCLSNLAVVLMDQGDLPGARAMSERALAINERVLGPDHPAVATDLSNLALVLRNQGDLPGARTAMERAFAIGERELSGDHPAVATRLSNLAGVLQDQGDLPGARAMAERALAINERVLGPDHPAVATLLSNLATVLQDQGDLVGARGMLERALSIDERVLGPDHPEVAIRLSNLATVLQDQGGLPGARAMLERALAIGERALGPDHPAVATRLSNLALVLRDQRDLSRARAMLERALAIAERALGPGHPNVATALANLALVLQDQGDLPGARMMLGRALTVLERRHGPDDPTLTPTLSALADVIRATGDGPAARDALERALEIHALHGQEQALAAAAFKLADLHGASGAWELARSTIERGLLAARSAEDPLLVAEGYRMLGDAALHGSDYDGARVHYEEAIRRYDALGRALTATDTRSKLVALMTQLGRPEAARRHAEHLRAQLAGGGVDEAARGEVEAVLRLVDAALRPGSPL